MNPLQIIFDFFKEMVNRIGSKSPMFFKVLQMLGASLTFAGYFPSMLQQWFNVEVSGNIISICETVAHYATGFFASSMLAVKAPTESMPITKAAEQKASYSAPKDDELNK